MQKTALKYCTKSNRLVTALLLIASIITIVPAHAQDPLSTTLQLNGFQTLNTALDAAGLTSS